MHKKRGDGEKNVVILVRRFCKLLMYTQVRLNNFYNAYKHDIKICNELVFFI